MPLLRHIRTRALVTGALLAAAAPGTLAQVTLDGTLGPAGPPPLVAGSYRIDETLGSKLGANLFHSFLQFDLDPAHGATFSGPADVMNVIARVTGASPSQINGTLASTIPDADVYVINPRGVVFGSNAQLSVSGSFFASTADVLHLADGGRFDAADPAGTILSAAAPSKFGFLSNQPAGIRVSGARLAVPRTETIALVGGSVEVLGGTLFASEGVIHVASVASAGSIGLAATGPMLNDFDNLGEVTLTQTTSGFTRNLNTCDLAGDCEGGGRVFIRGRRLVVDGGGVNAISFGNLDGGLVDVLVTENVRVIGESTIDTRGFGPGRAGDIELVADTIDLGGNALLTATGAGGGDAGSVRLSAREIRGSEHAEISSDTFGSGHGGDVRLEADRIHLTDDIFVTSSTLGLTGGDAGSVTIVADRLDMDGDATIDAASLANSPGRGGRIVIDVGTLAMSENAWIVSNTLAPGPGGVIEVVAGTIQMAGLTAISTTSFSAAAGGDINIASNVLDLRGNAVITSGAEGTGPGGTLTISGGSLVLAQQATISTQSEGSNFFVRGAGAPTSVGGGDAGDVAIGVANLSGSGGARIESGTSGSGTGGALRVTTGDFALASGASVSTTTSGTGDAGEIEVRTSNATLLGGASVTSSSTGTGDAGQILLTADDAIRLDSSRLATDAERAFGGNIDVQANHLIYLNNSEVTTSVGQGVGSGGDISIDPDFVVLNNSRIIAQADAGSGGNIRIVTGLFLASQDSVVDASARSGIDGTVQILSPESDSVSGVEGLDTEFVDAAALLASSCAARGAAVRQGSFVVAQRRGLRPAPDGLLPSYSSAASLWQVSATGNAPAPGDFEGEATVVRAATAFENRQLEDAKRGFEQVSQAMALRGNTRGESIALSGLADAEHALGAFSASAANLRKALAQAEDSGDTILIASAAGGLGNALLALGESDEAERQLVRGARIAEEAGEPAMAAGILNNLGNQYSVAGAVDKARLTYEHSAALAATAGTAGQELRSLANLARAALAAGDAETATRGLQRVKGRLPALEDKADKAELLLHAAESLLRLAKLSPEQFPASLKDGYEALVAAAAIAEHEGDTRMLSYAIGLLGALYHAEHRIDEALYLTRRAIRLAQTAQAPDSEYRWHHQEGKLLWEQGQPNASLRAYRRAATVVDESRQESLALYGSSQANFRQAIAPVYLDLVDALLQGASLVDSAEDVGKLLTEAITTIEQFKAAELRDYFRDECVASLENKAVPLDRVSQRAAVVYPILLPDRLELLVYMHGSLSRYRVPAASSEVTAAVNGLRRAIRSSQGDYLTPAKRLYDWLVRPYETDLAGNDIDTLVFVPDGPLRHVPIAALHDGTGFLVERFALAVTPTLTLTDPQPLTRESSRVMLAGIGEKVQGFPALKFVPQELDAIQRTYGGHILLDAGFTEERFAAEINQTEPTIVHVASHAEFTGDPQESFLLAYDGRITMDELEGYLGVAKYRERPLELLVLSACETAAGDDRAALGLSGVAIKAGARSALGSLWSINDEATSELFGGFYQELTEKRLSKAQALQAAQIDLIGTPRFAHPFFWSPFLLINNWL